MYNVILAAGDGKRFKKYNLPKILLKVDKKPLFIHATKSLPKNYQNIFIFKKKHYENYKEIKKIIKNNFNNFKIILIKKTTKGQASTLFKIKKIIKKNKPIFVTSADLCFSYDKLLFKKYMAENSNIIFACSPTKEMRMFPNQFGWVRSDKKNNLIKLSCKKKIIGNSKKDNVILGAFMFSKLDIFLKGYNKMVTNKIMANNEYYIDLLMTQVKNVKVIKVKKFINWGTPLEYEKNKNKIL